MESDVRNDTTKGLPHLVRETYGNHRAGLQGNRGGREQEQRHHGDRSRAHLPPLSVVILRMVTGSHNAGHAVHSILAENQVAPRQRCDRRVGVGAAPGTHRVVSLRPLVCAR